MTETLWWIKQSELFRRLSTEQLARLEAASRSLSFPARAPVMTPEDESECVYLLTEGMLKVSNLTDEGREAILAFIEPGELFGELALLDNTQREEYIVALEKSTVVSIPATEMRQMMAEHSELALGVMKLVGLRRKRVERRLRNLLFRSNRERLVHLLLDIAEQFGVKTDQGVELKLRLSHQDLAGLIGSTRESVTLLMGELKEAGETTGGRRQVVMVNPCRLAQSVGRDSFRLAPTPTSAEGQLNPCFEHAV